MSVTQEQETSYDDVPTPDTDPSSTECNVVNEDLGCDTENTEVRSFVTEWNELQEFCALMWQRAQEKDDKLESTDERELDSARRLERALQIV